jgi:GNAT superfamily N-acetyltransferase
MTDTITVSSLDRRDEGDAAALLARNFDCDPLLTALVPDAARRKRLALLGFSDFVRLTLPFDESYGAWEAGRLVGIALSLPPGTYPLQRSLGERLRLGIGAWRIAGWRAARVSRAFRRLDAAHPRRAHWYLPFMAVDEAYRGQGTGTRMLKAALTRVDSAGLPAYVETFQDAALPLYRRAGFDVTGELNLGAGLPTGRQLLRAGRLGLT